MASTLFIRIRGRVLGPFDQEKLRSLASRGQFGRMHEVSEDGVGWARASQYPELFRAEETIALRVEPASHTSTATAAAAPKEPVIPVATAAPTVALDAAQQPGWHYAHNGRQYGPVSFSLLKAMLADGRLPPDETVWTNGMSEWLPATEIDGLMIRAVTNGKAGGTLSDGVVSQLRDSRPWILFFAVISLLSTVLSLAGGVFLLIMAAKTSRTVGPVLAGQSIGSLVSALLNGISAAMLFSFAAKCRDCNYHRNEHSLQTALAAMKSIISYWGVITVIGIVLALIIVIYVLVLI